jgi:hypothetical protein
MSNLITNTVISLLLGVLIYGYYSNYNTGRDGADFDATCVNGQTVMVAEFGSKMAAYNALTDDGKPIACQGDYKNERSWNPFAIDGDDWKAKCFLKQRVYQANYWAKQATVTALTPDGKPQTCDK